jgi:hypothetical protein
LFTPSAVGGGIAAVVGVHRNVPGCKANPEPCKHATFRPRKGPVNEAWTIKSKVSIYFFSPCCFYGTKMHFLMAKKVSIGNLYITPTGSVNHCKHGLERSCSH